ncbi:TPA: site-specific DNA-methyltransferase [Campylobacter coli]
MLYNDDCLNILNKMDACCIDMIYLDPPFFTQKKQKLINSNGKKYEFSDNWESREDYLKYMRIRLLEMKRVLKETGNLFLHCDSNASHYLKILLDEIFCEKNFRSEIIWTYKRWSNSQKGLIPNHQIILFYSKSDKFHFNTLYCDYSATTNIDQILQERERNEIGKVVYKKNKNGDIINSKEKKGVPLSDVWDIPFLNPKAKERIGYPTQKPLELLDRIIKIGSNENDLIFDPFCGSGTTLVSAKLLNRKYIGVDINSEAIALTKQRLNNPIKTNSNLLKKGVDIYKTKTEKELSILKQFDCNIVQRNKGVDAFLKKHYLNAPVAIKIKKDSESLHEAIALLDETCKKKKCSFTILITDEIVNISQKLIPTNMIIIPQYQTQFEMKIQ